MRRPAYSTTLAPGGMKIPASDRAKERSGARQSRKFRQRLADTEYTVPGGLLRSRYSGARCGRRWGLMLVAHTKRPRVCSSPLRETFLVASSSCSWACSFASLFWARLIVSMSRLSCHPHQRMLFPKWTLRQDMGASEEGELFRRGWPV